MDLFGFKARRVRKEEIEKTQKFSDAFGFCPSDLPDAKSWEQLVVDRQLKQLGEWFQQACATQEDLMAQPEGMQGRIERYHLSLSRAAEAVERTKNKFWAAHAAAKEAGFSVKEKYSDYLDHTPPIDKLTKD